MTTYGATCNSTSALGKLCGSRYMYLEIKVFSYSYVLATSHVIHRTKVPPYFLLHAPFVGMHVLVVALNLLPALSDCFLWFSSLCYSTSFPLIANQVLAILRAILLQKFLSGPHWLLAKAARFARHATRQQAPSTFKRAITFLMHHCAIQRLAGMFFLQRGRRTDIILHSRQFWPVLHS